MSITPLTHFCSEQFIAHVACQNLQSIYLVLQPFSHVNDEITDSHIIEMQITFHKKLKFTFTFYLISGDRAAKYSA